jgi:hypothetical protein
MVLTCNCVHVCVCAQGKPLVEGTLEAVAHVLRGLQLSAASPSRYTFLVYNGSVHHWHVSRPLHTVGLRHHLLPSLEQVGNRIMFCCARVVTCPGMCECVCECVWVGEMG